MESNQELLIRIDERVKSLQEDHTTVSAKLLEHIDKCDIRVSALERWRSYLAGAQAVVVTGLGWLFGKQ